MSGEQDPDCIFCKIISHEIPAAIIHEDDDVIAFCDAFPAAEGHALVVPKAHAQDILHATTADVTAVARTAQAIAGAQQRALQPDGMTVTQFNGEAAGQTVFHYHVHVVPRWKGQSRASHGRDKADPEALKAVAERLSAALGR